MPVVRKNLNDCIGCENCATYCPRDVMRFDYEAMKSVIAYPENCQNCGQCYMYCLGHSIEIDGYTFAYALASYR